MLHGGQFAILKQAVNRPGYQTLALSDGWTLSYHEKLPVQFDADRKLLLLGYAWQVLPGRGCPWDELMKLSPERVCEERLLEIEESWCGRYVLIHDGTVYTDTAAVLAVFHSKDGVSSDISILTEAAGLETKIYQAEWKELNWFPAPLTPYEGIFRLLADQIYDYHSGKIHGRQLLAQHWKPSHSEEEMVAEFTRLFCHSLLNMHALLPDKKFLVALTGGYDSRTLFALMLRARLDFTAYTFQHGKISQGDIDVPPLLCELMHVPYRYYPVDSAAYSEERLQEFMTQISGLVWETDRLFYAYGQYQKLIAEYGDVVFLRSGIYEAVQEYNRRFVSNPFDPQEIYNHYELAEGSPERKSFEAFFAWCAENPQEISDCDRFNWSQLSGCWLANTEQSFDMYDHALSLHPVNCRVLMTLLHAFPIEQRREKYHQARITAYACPAIADVPYGTRKKSGVSVAGRVVNKFSKAANRLRKTGLRNTIKTYQKIFGDMWQSARFSKHSK